MRYKIKIVMLSFFSCRELTKGRISRGCPCRHVPAEEGVFRQWGESPSCCRGDHLPGHTEERVLWPARTKWYGTCTCICDLYSNIKFASCLVLRFCMYIDYTQLFN